jgi:serine/threonine-protein kinase HipA
MSMNGKRDGFTLEDFQVCARSASLKRGKGKAIVEEVRAAVLEWPKFAADAGVAQPWIEKIRKAQRLALQ